jgi:hypothetical protein
LATGDYFERFRFFWDRKEKRDTGAGHSAVYVLGVNGGFMDSLDDLKQIAKEKSTECKVQSCAYSITLSSLVPANFVLVVGAALLSLVAGASILTKNELISELQAGIMALVSGGFTIIHSKLGCDQYQAERNLSMK